MTARGRHAPVAAAPAVPAPDHEMFVPVPHGRLYVRVNGAVAGPRLPLVMLHGGPGGSHHGFVRALPLAAERAIILYDQGDCGRSEGTMEAGAWRLERFVAEIEAVRVALGIARWHLLGHSWGAALALAYAAPRPAALAGLILSSPLVSTRSWLADAAVLRARLPASAPAPAAPPGEPDDEPDAETRAFYERFYMRRPRAPEADAYLRALPRSFTPALYRAMWGRSEFVCTGTLADHDGEPLLDRIDGRRTLFVTGRHDEARPATVARFARRAEARFASIAGAGHSTLNDNQPRMLGVIARFLRRQDRLAA